MEEHLVELDSLKFLPFNYKRLPNYNPSSANIFGMSFGLFMIAAPMMGWIDYNSPTLGSILCFGGICEYIIGFFNWYDGRGIQSFIDFVFGLLHLTIYYTTELGKYSIPIPYEYYTDHKIRKYGAHGTSHYYVSQRTIEYLGHPEHSNVIVCHLGAGASLCAVKDGKSYNTSMGLTPLAGVMMSTRCGDIDASVIDYLDENLHMSIKDITNMLNKKSGLLGVSGVSGDMRDVKAAADESNERAKLAIDIFIRRVADYIGKYFVQLGKVDAISFTAGIGENAPWVRKLILEAVGQALGIVIDDDANENGKGERLISAPESKVKVYVIPTNEELVIARDAKKILNL